MADISQIRYEMEYTEGITPPNADLEQEFQEGVSNASVILQIVVARIPFSRQPDLDLIQSTPFKAMALKIPHRVLMVSERSLNFLDLESPRPTPQNEASHVAGSLRRSLCEWEMLLAKMASWSEVTPCRGLTIVDVAIKLNRHLQLLEEETKKRAKREMAMYSSTVAFQLFNSSLWFCH
ncbi:hypothetical protein K5549_009384 [Capra hircus]|uniref:Mitochondrial fission factor n=1 Tax=Capra hircus TaxID=9925 RepID=A0A452FPT1_CAPHI|nr:hypothetical protein K5549_009384 [Capra hircus]